MNYKVECSRRGKVFGTLEEAIACANEILEAVNIMVSIVETEEKVTHIYELNKGEA